MISKYLVHFKPLLSILFVIIIWQLAHGLGFTNRNLFPGPWDVATAAVKLFNDGVMIKDLKTSVSRAAAGFSIGASLGILAGILTARVALVRLAVYPFFNILRPIPAIALVPIAIVWFGIGEESKPRITAWNTSQRRIFARLVHWVRLGGASSLRWWCQRQHRIYLPVSDSARPWHFSAWWLQNSPARRPA